MSERSTTPLSDRAKPTQKPSAVQLDKAMPGTSRDQEQPKSILVKQASKESAGLGGAASRHMTLSPTNKLSANALLQPHVKNQSNLERITRFADQASNDGKSNGTPTNKLKALQANRHETVTEEQMAVHSRSMTKKYAEFVKLTDVKEIVSDITLPLLKLMQTREEEAISMKNQVTILAGDMKKMRAQTRTALLLKQNVTDNSKAVKKLDQRFDGLDVMIHTIEEVVEHKINRVSAELDLHKREQQKFFDISAKRNENYMDLADAFDKHLHESMLQLTKFKNETNNQLITQDGKINKVFQIRQAIIEQEETFKKEMMAKWDESAGLILEKLKVQELRMQEIEMRHLAVLDFQKKFTEFSKKFTETIQQLDNLKDLPKVIERSLPLLTHFQICEGLRKTIGELVPQKLLDFERNKLGEILEFQTKYMAFEPNLKFLSTRLRLIAKSLQANNIGMAPFTFDKDFFPNMASDAANTLSQIERMALGFNAKLRSSDSIIEHLVLNLQDIQREKNWSNEQTGKEFAEMLTKEGPSQVSEDMLKEIMAQLGLDDDYGAEDYGQEVMAVQQPQFKSSPLQNDKLKRIGGPSKTPNLTVAPSASKKAPARMMSTMVCPSGVRSKQSTLQVSPVKTSDARALQGGNDSPYSASIGRGRGRGGMLQTPAESPGGSFRGKLGRLGLGRGANRPTQIQLSLCQKPTKAFQMKLDATLRDMKRRGFGLYIRAKEETNEIVKEVKEICLKMKEDQERSFQEQDKKIAQRVETRLSEIQADFLIKTEAAAQEIFDRNHKFVLGKLSDAQARVDEVVKNHFEQKQLHDELFKQNKEAILLHNEVKRVFKEESEAFFAERLKWKTDVQSQMVSQNKAIDDCLRTSDQLQRKVQGAISSLSMITDSIILTHLVVSNIANDMAMVNLMGTRHDKDILQDTIGSSRRASPSKIESSHMDDHHSSPESKINRMKTSPIREPKLANVFDLSQQLQGAAIDHRAQTRLINQVKIACLNFKVSPIAYNHSKFHQVDVVQITQKILMQLQQKLGNSGIYGTFYKCYEGKKLFIQPLIDYASYSKHKRAEFSQQARHMHSSPSHKRGTSPQQNNNKNAPSPRYYDSINRPKHYEKDIRVPQTPILESIGSSAGVGLSEGHNTSDAYTVFNETGLINPAFLPSFMTVQQDDNKRSQRSRSSLQGTAALTVNNNMITSSKQEPNLLTYLNNGMMRLPSSTASPGRNTIQKPNTASGNPRTGSNKYRDMILQRRNNFNQSKSSQNTAIIARNMQGNFSGKQYVAWRNTTTSEMLLDQRHTPASALLMQSSVGRAGPDAKTNVSLGQTQHVSTSFDRRTPNIGNQNHRQDSISSPKGKASSANKIASMNQALQVRVSQEQKMKIQEPTNVVTSGTNSPSAATTDQANKKSQGKVPSHVVGNNQQQQQQKRAISQHLQLRLEMNEAAKDGTRGEESPNDSSQMIKQPSSGVPFSKFNYHRTQTKLMDDFVELHSLVSQKKESGQLLHLEPTSDMWTGNSPDLEDVVSPTDDVSPVAVFGGGNKEMKKNLLTQPDSVGEHAIVQQDQSRDAEGGDSKENPLSADKADVPHQSNE